MARRVEGFTAAGVHCGIKTDGALDLAVIVSDRVARAAGVFTRNRFPGAPVQVSKRHLRGGLARGVVVNSRVSNVATGSQGLADAREMTRLLAREIGARPSEIQVASTGVIGWPLPMDEIRSGIPHAVSRLSPSGWRQAARAIMTTDTVPKLAEAKLERGGLVGIAKGVAMCEPNMATVLGFLASDAAVEPGFLKESLDEAIATSFNALTIDGETSTSDTVVVLANGAAGGSEITSRSARARDWQRALTGVCVELVDKLALDGEGVSKLADVIVTGARSNAHADKIARRVAGSALVKTALFGGDPNWGRVIQALGAAGVPFRPDQVDVTFAGVEMLHAGEPVGGDDAVKRAARAMRRKRVAIEISVGKGAGSARVLTTDLTYEYVRLNAEYTT